MLTRLIGTDLLKDFIAICAARMSMETFPPSWCKNHDNGKKLHELNRRNSTNVSVILSLVKSSKGNLPENSKFELKIGNIALGGGDTVDFLSGSEQESDRGRTLSWLLDHPKLGTRCRHALRVEQQIAQILVAAAPA
jgi:hypothetical protein